MAIFRQYIAPLLVVLLFLVALFVVSARIFLPADMAAPAPTEEPVAQPPTASNTLADVPLGIDVLVHGLPLELGAETPL